MRKLTLSVDERVIARAKRYASQKGVSISQMVAAYLAAVSQPAGPGAMDTPILDSIRGCLKKAGREDYRKHLEAKYR